MNRNTFDQAIDNTQECDDEPELETIYARESAPMEIGSLIRSKADALSLHSVIRGHVIEMRGVGQDQCASLGKLIKEKWDAEDLSEHDVKVIEDLVRQLLDLYDESDCPINCWDDAVEYGAVESVLHALRFAASCLVARMTGQSEQIAD